MGFTANLKSVAEISADIASAANEAKVSKMQCLRLASRVNTIASAIELQQTILVEHPLIDKVLQVLIECLDQCLNLILRKFKHTPTWDELLDFRMYEEKFAGYNLSLRACAENLRLDTVILDLERIFDMMDDTGDHDSDFEKMRDLFQQEFENMVSLLQGECNVVFEMIDTVIGSDIDTSKSISSHATVSSSSDSSVRNEFSEVNPGELLAEHQRIKKQVESMEKHSNNILRLMTQFDAIAPSIASGKYARSRWEDSTQSVRNFVDSKLQLLRNYVTLPTQRYVSTSSAEPSHDEIVQWIQERKGHLDAVSVLNDEIKEMIARIKQQSTIVNISEGIAVFQLSSSQMGFGRPLSRSPGFSLLKSDGDLLLASHERPLSRSSSFSSLRRNANPSLISPSLPSLRSPTRPLSRKSNDPPLVSSRHPSLTSPPNLFPIPPSHLPSEEDSKSSLESVSEDLPSPSGGGLQIKDFRFNFVSRSRTKRGGSVSSLPTILEEESAKKKMSSSRRTIAGHARSKSQIIVSSRTASQKHPPEVSLPFTSALHFSRIQIPVRSLATSTRTGLFSRKTASQNEIDSQKHKVVGNLPHSSRGISSNDPEIQKDDSKTVNSLQYLQRAATHGNAEAQFNLGVGYANDSGVGKNETLATHWIRKAAEQGHVDAQYYLGVRYVNGQGVEKDDANAVYWFSKAVKQEHAGAQFELGVAYFVGRGIERDEMKALHLYQDAADGGHPKAQFLIGSRYARGLDGEKSEVKAFYWYRKAAEQGYVRAQLLLGSKYVNGEGVGKDEARAFRWYQLAAAPGGPGHAEAQFIVGSRYADGRGIEKDLTLAFQYYQLAAAPRDAKCTGHAGAQFNLGLAYDSGAGIEKDEAIAAHYYQLAANQGHAGAQFNLGVAYSNGQGVEKNEEKAVYWYRKAAEQGDADAQFNTGLAYSDGEGAEKDEEKAVYWYRKAADQGNTEAQFNLGLAYDSGIGVEKDEKQAIFYYQLAANQGDPDAQFNVGSAYANGEGVEKDKVEAVHWYQKAAVQGHVDAQQRLVIMSQKLNAADK